RIDDAGAGIENQRVVLLLEVVLDDRSDAILQRPHLLTLGLLKIALSVLLHPLPRLLLVVGLLGERFAFVLRHGRALVVELLDEVAGLFLDLVELLFLLIGELLEPPVGFLARRRFERQTLRVDDSNRPRRGPGVSARRGGR